ncbi:lipoprotein [Pullulanibacillus camelliae]|uniref:Lipoprotein n=1 Tax=Pullulanibacillus camelliae TaxID=1707096 RepID=A0A8J3DUA3_9BACL|nr:aromatic acid exporter family protein [Pullulanibacillus camelliae]GGE45534.1 lipoprotein [Pullulanibacillus camelliae]
MKLGARIIKTGLAIVLSLYLSELLGLKPVSMAAVASAFAIQPSVYRSWQSIVDNVQANIIGAIIASIFVLMIGNHPIVIGLAVIVVIAIQLKLKLNHTITLSTVTVILIMSGTPENENFLLFAGNRLILILLGVVSAFIVNLVFMPPNYENKLYHLIVGQTTKLFTWVRMVTQHAPERATLKTELKHFQDQKFKIGQFFLWYQDERKYLRKHRYAKNRKTVLFRQMIATTNKLNELLRTMNENDHLYQQLPDILKNKIQDRLENMMVYHERLLMRYNNKVRDTAEDPGDSFQLKTVVTDEFIKFYKTQSEEEWIHLFPFIAAIIAYAQQLERLDRLMDSFQAFHKKENVVAVKNEDED